MNWFKKQEFKEANVPTSKQMTKTASAGENWDNQEGDWLMFGNVNRYRLDAYAIKVFISKTKYNWTISLMTNHAYLGTAQYNVFWRYGLDEEKRARKTFKEINKIVKEVVEDFIDNEKPSSMFDCTLRQRIQQIDQGDLTKTNIPSINYSYDIDYSGDWDKNIYGGRYPIANKPEDSFKEYLNNSYYVNDKRIKGKFSL